MTRKGEDKIFNDGFHPFFAKLDKRRSKLLFLIIQAMSSVGTVNLVKVAAGLKTEVSQQSNYRRIQRYIHEVRLGFGVLSPLIISLSGVCAPYTLLLDRTNWKFGCVDINFLVLSVKGGNWAVPLMWKLLPKKGNSSQKERIELMKEFIAIFGPGKVHTLLADREFIGAQWIGYLNEAGIPYDIRIRENLKVGYRGREVSAHKLFKRLKLGQRRTIEKMVLLNGVYVYLQGEKIINTKNHKEEYLIVISYDDPHNGIKRYGERWYIENMFKDLKSNGFNLKDTHLKNPQRLESLFAVVALAYTWMIKIGKISARKYPRRLRKKSHGRRAKSIFRLGFDQFLRAICTNSTPDIRCYLKLLSCT